jgi:hypothetical protein
MTTTRDPDTLIQAFLDDGIDELPDSSYDVVRAAIDRPRQRVVLGPWRDHRMSKFALLTATAAAVVLAAVIGIRGLPPGGGMWGAPAATASPAPSPIVDPNGRLEPGTYVVHPFDTPIGMDGRAFTFDVPSTNWEAVGDPGQTIGVVWNDGSDDSHGVGLGFLKVHSVNGDPCHWSGTEDDIPTGTTLNDLLAALQRLGIPGSRPGDTSPFVYSKTYPNTTGWRFELVMPATLLESDVNCDEGGYHIWNAEGFDIDAQGPSNIWRLAVTEGEGERYIIMASYMPSTPDEVRAELLDGIFNSVR